MIKAINSILISIIGFCLLGVLLAFVIPAWAQLFEFSMNFWAKVFK